MPPTDVIWVELRRLDGQSLAQTVDSTRLQGEVDELCSRVERLEGDMKNVATKTDLQHSRDVISGQITGMKEGFDPIRRGIYAVVWLIIGAVVVGGLAFLINKPGP